MGTLASTRPTHMDVVSRMDPDFTIAQVAELLKEATPVFDHGLWMESNLPTGHRDVARTSLSTPTWRKFNAFGTPTKTRASATTDSMGMLEDWSEIDCRLAELNGNSAAWRLSEDAGKIQGIAKECEATFFNGNEGADEAEFTGVAARYSSTTALNGANVFAASSSDTDATSIYLINWAMDKFRLIYPKGTPGGLRVEDEGKTTAQSSDTRMRVYRTWYGIDMGLAIKDWRACARFQFDTDDVTATASSGPNLDEYMRKMIRRVKLSGPGQLRFYASIDALQMIDWQAANKTTLGLQRILDAQGQLIETFLGIPIYQCDALTSTETSIS